MIQKACYLCIFVFPAIATVTAYPKGHLNLYNTPCPPSPTEDLGVFDAAFVSSYSQILFVFSAIATVTAYPNGHLNLYNTPPPNCPPSPTEDSGVIPMRPVYPRTQYQMQYGSQGPPRVNAGDISQASGKSYRLISSLNMFVASIHFASCL